MLLDGIGALVLARLRRRPGQWLSIGGAVAAAAALIGILAGLSVGATDQAIGRALTGLDEGDRSILVTRFAPTDHDAVAFDEAARSGLTDVGDEVGPTVGGVILNRARDPRHLDAPDVQILAADDLARWTSVTSGRLPGACSATVCEALLISGGATAEAVPTELAIAGRSLRIVGRGVLTSPLPVGRPDLATGRSYDLGDIFDSGTPPPPAYLLVEGTRAIATDPGLAAVGRTYRWLAPLDAARVHPWTVATLTERIGHLRQELAATTFDFSVVTPEDAVAAEVARGTTAAGRLQLIGALAVAVLVAFAVFAGIVVRGDVALEVRRIRRLGGTRTRVAIFLVLEVLVPAVVAAVVGLTLAALGVAAIAVAGGMPPGSLVVASLLAPGTLGLAAVVALAGAAAVLTGILFTPRRGFVVGLLPGILAVGAIVAWQLVAGEGLAAQLGRGSLGGPALILLPAVLAFFVTGAFLVALPFAFRALARRSGRARLPLRLAVLSLARDPARPAATLTLLAFSLGALVFAVGYGETVRTGIADQAAYEVGADLRVTEAGSATTLAGTVAPLARYADLGPGVETWPVLRRSVSVEPGRPITLIGIDPAALDRLAGWRTDFSDVAAAEVGRRLTVPGDFTMRGHRLPPSATTLDFEVGLQGDPVALEVTVATTEGEFARVSLGSIGDGESRIAAKLPLSALGGTVVAIRISDTLPTGGPSHPGSLGRSTVAFTGLSGLVDDGVPVAAEIGGLVERVVRAPLPTDDEPIPALVSPGIAAASGPDGSVTIPLGDSVVRLRVVATASRFPTVLGADEGFVVAAYAPLLLAMNGASPGAGYPDEMWLRTPDAATAELVASRLAQPPYRSAVVRSRVVIADTRANDPFAAALATADLVTALAGLALAWLGLALGAVADQRDESGELADLETQGVPASTLRTLAQVRTVVLAGAGVAAGLAVGIALTVVTTSTLALAAGATIPVPSLRVEVPWVPVVALALAPLVAASLFIAVASRRPQVARR